MPDFRSVLFVAGFLLLALAASMLLPAAIDLLAGNADWHAFLISALITGGTGGALILGYRPSAAIGIPLIRLPLMSGTVPMMIGFKTMM